MQSFVGALRRSAGADSNPVRVYLVNSFRPLVCISRLNSPGLKPVGLENVGFLPTLSRCLSSKTAEVNTGTRVCNNNNLFLSPLSLSSKSSFDATSSSTFAASSGAKFTSRRYVTTSVNPVEMPSQESSVPAAAADDLPISPRIKFKRLDKTARHIMQILDKEAVTSVKEQREIVDVKPGYIIQMKVESPENKRRISTIKGIVIARRNAGLNTTFRLRRLVAGVGVESLFPLYSPNIKEIKVIDKKKVRRAKLYHLRERMNALRR